MTMQQNPAPTASPAPRRWSAARTALTTAGLAAVLVALTACGPGGSADGASTTAPTTATTPASVATPAVGAPLTDGRTPTTTGAVTSDPGGFMSMDMTMPTAASDQQFVDADGNHVNISRNTGGGSSTISNSSCDASGCESQVIEND